MHKSIYIPFLLIVLFDMTHTARGQSIYLDNIDNNTSAVKKAGVSKEFIYVFEIKKDKLRDSGIAVVITYDTSGCVVSSERYDLPFDPKAKTIYYYNDRLKLIKMATSYSKQTPATVEIAYDSVGREIFRSEYSRFRRLWFTTNSIILKDTSTESIITHRLDDCSDWRASTNSVAGLIPSASNSVGIAWS
jgi:hypothetical protein